MSEEQKQETVDAEEQKRKVVIASKVKVVFTKEGETEEHVVNRDVYSVMDEIAGKLSATKSKEEMDLIKVSVHSMEDPDKSDPLEEGGTRWEAGYLVAGAEIENLSIPDAMKELTKVVIPSDQCLVNIERLAEQLFLRSRLDGIFVVATFDGVPATVPLLTSFRPVSAESFKALHQSMLSASENLRKWVASTYPDVAEELGWVRKEAPLIITNPAAGVDGKSKGIII